MTDKTIKELADILGVSKDKVKYQLRKLPSNFTYKKGNIIYLKKEAVTTITKVLSGNEPGNLPSELPDSLPTDYLLKEIETKNNHIEEKDRQIEKTSTSFRNTTKITRPATTTHPASQPTNRETAGTTTVDLYGRIFGK